MKKVLKAVGLGILYLLVFEVVQVMVTMMASLVIAFLHPYDYTSTVYSYINLIGALADFVCIGALVFIIKIRGKSIKVETGIKAIDWKSALACLVGGIALVILVNNILAMLPIPDRVWEEYAESSMSLLAGPKWAQILFTVIAAPLCEEIVFRGLVFNSCRKAMPQMAAVMVSALFFGIVHGQLLWISYAFACGFFLAMAYCNTGSLLGCILMHIGVNGFSQFAPETWDLTGWGWLIVSAIILVGTYVIMRPVKAIYNETKEVEL